MMLDLQMIVIWTISLSILRLNSFSSIQGNSEKSHKFRFPEENSQFSTIVAIMGIVVIVQIVQSTIGKNADPIESFLEIGNLLGWKLLRGGGHRRHRRRGYHRHSHHRCRHCHCHRS